MNAPDSKSSDYSSVYFQKPQSKQSHTTIACTVPATSNCLYSLLKLAQTSCAKSRFSHSHNSVSRDHVSAKKLINIGIFEVAHLRPEIFNEESHSRLGTRRCFRFHRWSVCPCSFKDDADLQQPRSPLPAKRRLLSAIISQDSNDFPSHISGRLVRLRLHL